MSIGVWSGGYTMSRMVGTRQSGRLALLVLVSILFFAGAARAGMPVDTTAARADKSQLREIEFKDATVQDAIRVLSEISGINIVATRDAGARRVTLFIRDLTVADAIDSLCRVAGLWYRHHDKTRVYVVMTTEEYFKDIIVFREESTEVFTLRYQNVVKIARTIEAMFGQERVELDLQSDFSDDLKLPGGSLTVEGGGSGTSSSGDGFDRRSRFGRGDSPRVRGGRAGVGRGGRDASAKQEIAGMTPDQIALLEEARELQGEGGLLLSEKTLASVRRRSRVPIFVSVNREHNLLFVRTADNQAMASIRRIVKESDRPTPQVLLEMKVMSVQIEDGFRSAFDFSFTGGGDSAGPPDGQPPNPLKPGDGTGPKALLGLVNATLGGSSTMVFQLMNEHIRARLELLESEGRVNLLATPMLLGANNRPARIFIGEQQVLTTGFSAQTTSAGGDGGNNTFVATPVPETEVVDVGNTLTILPSINSDRTVLMRLLQESSRPKVGGGSIPVVAGNGVTTVRVDTIDKSTIEGTVMAKSGLTVVVGGMITDALTTDESKVPLLGDLPGLGMLFRETKKKSAKRELILLITPHVLSTPEEAEAVSRQRLDDLLQHPSSIDLYLDEVDRNRSRSEHGRSISASVAQASPVAVGAAGGRLESSYREMVQFAARQLRLPWHQRPLEAGIEKARLKNKGARRLLDLDPVDIRPVASWTNGALYVTALKMLNQTGRWIDLERNVVHGNWLAIALEQKRLGPQGGGQEATYLYLVSDRPFERAEMGGG